MLLKNKIVVLLIFASPIIFLSFSKKEKEDPFYLDLFIGLISIIGSLVAESRIGKKKK